MAPPPGEVVFADGLVGCPTWRHFRLLDGPTGSPLKRLQSLSDPAVCFIVVDPELILPDYVAAIPPDELSALELDDPAQADVFVTLVARGQPATVTANLLAPLVVNPQTGSARQVVLVESGHSIQHPVAALSRVARLPAKGGQLCSC